MFMRHERCSIMNMISSLTCLFSMTFLTWSKTTEERGLLRGDAILAAPVVLLLLFQSQLSPGTDLQFLFSLLKHGRSRHRKKAATTSEREILRLFHFFPSDA